MLADSTAVVPGQEFQLGAHFKIQDAHHIYWENPGDAGLPTKVSFEAPEGIEILEAQYPIPERFEDGADIITFGHTKEALLTFKAKVTSSFSVQGPVEIKANARWLSCNKTLCIPGAGKASIQLPVGKSAEKENQKTFLEWKQRSPLSYPAETKGKLKSAGGTGTFESVIDWEAGSPPKKLDWLPYSHPGLEADIEEVEVSGNDIRVQFHLKELKGIKREGDIFRYLLSYREKGKLRAIEVEVPIL